MFRLEMRTGIGILVLLVVLGLVAGVRQWTSTDPASSFSAARSAIERDELVLAKARLEECLAAAPRYPEARIYYGQVLRDLGQTDRAVEVWHSVQEGSRAERSMARFLEGAVAIERSRVDRSRDLLCEALRLDPTNLRAREKLVGVYRMLRAPEKLVEQLDEIARQRPLDIQERIYRTIPQDSGFPLENSLSVLETSLRANPADAESLLALVTVLRTEGQAGRALERCTGRRESGALGEQFRAEEILAKLDLDRVHEAEDACSKVEDEQAGERLRFACGRAAFVSGQYARTARLLQQVVRHDPDNRETCYLLGVTMERLQNPRVAAALAARTVLLDNLHRQCVRLTQGDALQSSGKDLMAEIARILMALERPAEAAEWYRLALEVSPEDQALREAYQLALMTPEPEVRRQLSGLSEVRTPMSSGTMGRRPAENGPNEVDGPLLLVDVHASAGLDHQYFNGETGHFHLIESMGGGAIVFDCNGDAWPDLYFPQGCRMPYSASNNKHGHRLFENQANGHFRDVTGAAGLGSSQYGLGGTALDYDNDGYDDLFVANFGRSCLYRNNGDGTFTDVSERLEQRHDAMTTSAVAADFNQDGFEDLYLTNYVTELKTCRNAAGGFAPCDPANFSGQADLLLVSDGTGGFRDVSMEAGVAFPGGRGLGAVAADFDADGQIDLYVANDGEPNYLFVNATRPGASVPEFVERGIVSGVALDESGKSQAGMGIAVGDLNGDGLLDLYVSNFYLEYNTLYRNLGQLQFVDDTRRAGLVGPTLPVLGFGTQAVDFDMDGDLDLFVANGHIARDPSGQQPWKMPAQVFQNRGDGVFRDASHASGAYFQTRGLGRGVAVLDWNRDGRQDLLVVYQDRPVALLENRTESRRRPITFRLVGTRSNRRGTGAVVVLDDGERERLVWRTADGGYLTCNAHELAADINWSTRDLTVTVNWPSGGTSRHGVRLNPASETRDSGGTWVLIEDGGTHSEP